MFESSQSHVMLEEYLISIIILSQECQRLALFASNFICNVKLKEKMLIKVLYILFLTIISNYWSMLLEQVVVLFLELLIRCLEE